MLIFLGVLNTFDHSMFSSVLFTSFYTVGESLLVLQIGLKLYLMSPEGFSFIFLVIIILISFAIQVIYYNDLWKNSTAKPIIIIITVMLYSWLIF